MLKSVDVIPDIKIRERYDQLLESRTLIDFNAEIDFIECVHDQIITVSTDRILLSQPEIKFDILQQKLHNRQLRNEIIAMPIKINSGDREIIYYLITDGNHSIIANLLEGCDQLELKLQDPISYMKYCGNEELIKAKRNLCLNRGALPRIVADFADSEFNLEKCNLS